MLVARKSSSAFFAGFAAMFAGCSPPEGAPASSAAGPPAVAASSRRLEGQLDIVAWPEYIERGESDTDYDWVTEFEARTGCRVNVTIANTPDDIVALMRLDGSATEPAGDAAPPAGGPFDLVTAFGDVALQLIRGGAVQSLVIERIPGYSTIDRRLQRAPWHYVDGKHWGVPFQWGPNVLLYNTEVFAVPPDSWSVVFEERKLPDGRSNKGRVQAYEAPIYIADAALYLAAKDPGLGITDPYALNAAQYEAALKVLRDQRPLVHRYWRDTHTQVRDFLHEGVVASGSWPMQANTLLANKAPVATTVPLEGATGWAASTLLAARARHPNCAYAWLEWSISPKVQGDVAAWIGANPVVPQACEGNELLGEDGCRLNGIDSFDRVRFWRLPEATCAASPEGCVPFSRWVADYALIQGSD